MTSGAILRNRTDCRKHCVFFCLTMTAPAMILLCENVSF